MSCDLEHRIEALEGAVRELREKKEPSLETKYAIREMQEAREEVERLKHQLQTEKLAKVYEREDLAKTEKIIKQQRAEIDLLRSALRANSYAKAIKAVRELMDQTRGVYRRAVTRPEIVEEPWNTARNLEILKPFYEAEELVAKAEKLAGKEGT